jgi:hypothetical protein
MTAPFDREKAARLADELAAELAKLDAMPMWMQKGGDVLSVAKFCMPSLARNLRSGLYDMLVPGANRPAWMFDESKE